MIYFLIGKNWKKAYPIGVRLFLYPNDWRLRRSYYADKNTSIYDIGPLQLTFGGND